MNVVIKDKDGKEHAFEAIYLLINRSDGAQFILSGTTHIHLIKDANTRLQIEPQTNNSIDIR